MKKTVLRVLAASLMLILSTSILSGCSKKVPEQKTAAPQTSNEPAKLSYWVPLNSNVAKFATNLGETPFGKQLQKDTNTTIEFKHPAVGQEADQFKLLLASGDLPDIVEYNSLTTVYPGGIDKAIEDKVFLSLNSILDKSAPNLKKIYTERPDIAKMAKTDSGNYYCFPFLRPDERSLAFYGPIVRQDWLNELGLKAPATIDELTNVLQQFKTKKNAETPLSFVKLDAITVGNDIFGAYGIAWGMFARDNKIKYGFYEPEYKELLTTMRKWYQDKLLDPDFLTQDAKAFDAKITSNKVGFTVGYAASTVRRVMEMMQAQNPKFELAGTPHLVKNPGDKPTFGQMDLPYTNRGAMISAKSKNVEAAVRLLDYGYSEKGTILMNYGIEGSTFKMENGKPKVTDAYINDLNTRYGATRGTYDGPLAQIFIEETQSFKPSYEAIKTWSNFKPSSVIPPLTPTLDESTKVAKLNSEIDTFAKEKFAKFVMGQESLDTFDKYIEQLKKMGIEDLIKLNQAAYDRAIKR
jgi:putative aldouronate transport system substrate-binding protein